ncbi:CgeB family protein [Acinetobacter larvae]|uniref:Spore protein YkvP/CgeB glycosyl transferase-like domain-containing protein n=1 Tax=Acinetobacter larvae TaxID=1789224 RepID=A0A1B2M2F5_9GAMM|nr:hypothetical protein [Acinetobacter larvae]AOA59203.1 hypothetical protein BFG52_13120 [Acinetobacter larvae]
MIFTFKTKPQFNILSILDHFTEQALSLEPHVNLIPAKTRFRPLFSTKIDMLLVESTWLGNQGHWQYQVASYPEHPQRNNIKLKKLIDWAKNKGIPTVFWNKEDPFHFEQFIASASLFDYIFTTDKNMINHYKKRLNHTHIYSLMFPIQPKIHYATPLINIKHKSSIFIGSYIKHMHSERQQWQDTYFPIAAQYGGLTIVDRHAQNTHEHYQFPQLANTTYLAQVPYEQTGHLYRQYQQALNVNTITDSPTMFSRRLLEIMACGRLAISNPCLAINEHFKACCEVIENQQQAQQLFKQLEYGYLPEQVEKINYACHYVQQNFNVQSWLQQILRTCNIDHPYLTL